MTELYGKCRELGFCDCGGFFGCVDDTHKKPPGPIVQAAPNTARPRADAKKVPYGTCALCLKPLFAGREHECKAGNDKQLYCDLCQTHYSGKPTDHMREVHGHVEPQLDPTYNGPINDESRRGAMERIRNQKKCPECGKYLRKDHVCKGAPTPKPEPKPKAPVLEVDPAGVARPKAPAPDPEKLMAEIERLAPKPPKSVELDMPKHTVVIKLASVEITIRPLA